MRPIEIVDFLRLEQPQLLGKMPDKKAAGLIRAALALISRRIDALEEGLLQVAGLGVFRVRRVEREKDGQKVLVRQVILRKGMLAAKAPATGAAAVAEQPATPAPVKKSRAKGAPKKTTKRPRKAVVKEPDLFD